MFMFRKKDIEKSISTDLQKEAQKFQKVVQEINENISPDAITIDVIESFSQKAGLDSIVLQDAFETYLRKNAIKAVRLVKSSDDYTVLNLEQAAGLYGFSTDELEVTYFSEE